VKEEVTGKRFSKVKTRSISSSGSSEEKRFFVDQSADRDTTEWRNFSNLVSRLQSVAKEILQSVNLPSSPMLYWVEGSTQWQHQKPDSALQKSCLLDHYIVNERGFQHDSKEGLSARIITLIEKLGWDACDSLEVAFSLGEAATLLKVYEVERLQNSRNAKKERRSVWAIALAEEYVKRFPDSTFESLWEEIPKSELCSAARYAGYEVYRDGERLYAVSSDRDESLAKSTFRTSYVSVAKKK